MTGKTHKIKMHAVAKIKNYKAFCQNVILLCLFMLPKVTHGKYTGVCNYVHF